MFGMSASHDYWLQPERYFLAPGDSLRAALYVGDHFAPELERELQKNMTAKLRLVSAGGEIDLLASAADSQKPVVATVVETPGTYLVALQRSFSFIELEAEKFNEYLQHEGLGHILAQRRAGRTDQTSGRERYARCVKALVQVGEEPDATATRILGETIEIVPEENPYRLQPGSELRFKILFEGRPLSGAQVNAHVTTPSGVATKTGFSDVDGRVRFLLDRTGVWMIRLVHMRKCPDRASADWESWWASLTFALAAR
jgi:uncharacterized GH25 family protein